MKYLNNVTIERSLTPAEVIGAPALCIFSDASNEAFGACAYFRWKTVCQSSVTRFVAAKSRGTPLKPLTTPRLELQAAVLAVRLYQSIVEESRMQFEKIFSLPTATSSCHGSVAKLENSSRPFLPELPRSRASQNLFNGDTFLESSTSLMKFPEEYRPSS